MVDIPEKWQSSIIGVNVVGETVTVEATVVDGTDKQIPNKVSRPAHLWKPGQSGNPKGRPKRKTFIELAYEYLGGADKDGEATRMERLVKVLVDKSLAGDAACLRELLSRVSPPLTRVKDETPPKQIVMVMQPEDPPEGWDPLKALQQGQAPVLPGVEETKDVAGGREGV